MMRGLVLSGGKSSRMGSPKAEICYQQEPEYLRCVKLLATVCSDVYLSTSEFWTPGPSDELLVKLLPDEPGASNGPLCGIAAAFKKHPDCAWFVLACDLPFFDDSALRSLLSHRDSGKDATCFVGFQQRVEPLCAIYEASARIVIAEAVSLRKHCTRKVLERLETNRVVPENASWVRNVNDANDRAQVNLTTGKEKWIEVKYVAQLRETAGKSVEKILTSRLTARSIYEDLAQEHGFLLSSKHMRVAINDEIVDWDKVVQENDRLLFVPPVAGG